MIQAKELRVFNYVHWNKHVGDLFQIVALDAYGHEVSVTDVDGYRTAAYISDIAPIPITPEWLERLGFEQQNGFGEWKKYVPEDGHGLYWTTHGRVFFHPHFNYECEIEFSHVEHIHQLQNLFYSLCGTELTAPAGMGGGKNK